MAVKMTVTMEPTGSEKATLRLTHTPAEGEVDMREVVVGTKSTVVSEVFELVTNSKLEVSVEKIVELRYDKDQATMVEVVPPVEPQEAKGVAAHGPKSHAESGAKEANATHEGRSKR